MYFSRSASKVLALLPTAASSLCATRRRARIRRIDRAASDGLPWKKAQLGFADLPQQSVYSRLAGYEGLNDAEEYDAKEGLVGKFPQAFLHITLINAALAFE